MSSDLLFATFWLTSGARKSAICCSIFVADSSRKSFSGRPNSVQISVFHPSPSIIFLFLLPHGLSNPKFTVGSLSSLISSYPKNIRSYKKLKTSPVFCETRFWGLNIKFRSRFSNYFCWSYSEYQFRNDITSRHPCKCFLWTPLFTFRTVLATPFSASTALLLTFV